MKKSTPVSDQKKKLTAWQQVYWVGALLLNLLIWGLLVLLLSNTTEVIPLNYNLYFGISLLGEKILLLIWPALLTIFLIINFSLAYFLKHREVVISYFLPVISIFVQLFGLVWLLNLRNFL